MCLKNRSKQKRETNINLDDNENELFASENSILFNFSDDSIKIASRLSQNFSNTLVKKENEQSSDECLNLIRSESQSSMCFESLNKSILMSNGVEESLMAVGYESNINVIKYHPFDFQIGKFNENPQLSMILYSK